MSIQISIPSAQPQNSYRQSRLSFHTVFTLI